MSWIKQRSAIRLFASGAFLGLSATLVAHADPFINEIRIDQPGSDNDEYFELFGTPGASLAGLSYLVIGDDNAGGSGTIEAVVDLPGQPLGANGFFLAAEGTSTLATADLTTDLNFENSDNVTHLLVSDFTGSDQQDLDTDDDGTLDVTPWSAVVDCVGLVETVGSGDLIYCDTTIGPDGTFVPGHVYRSPDGGAGTWQIGAFDPDGGNDTPTSGRIPDTDPGACGDPATLIGAVQGSGAASPLVGQEVFIEGVVTADRQTGLNGFFLQEEDSDADADPDTSEGIFVFTGLSPVTVTEGEVARVRGTVAEYNAVSGATETLTRISPVAGVVDCDTTASVTPVDVQLPFSDLNPAERFEGMRVNLTQPLTVTETFDLGRGGQLTLSAGDRLYQPTQLFDPGAPANAQQLLNNLNKIVLDDGSTDQNPEPIPYPTGGLSAQNTVRGGDTVSNITGVLSYGDAGYSESRTNAYRIHPTAQPAFTASNPRPTTPAPVSGSVRVVSFNVLNYFVTLDENNAQCGPPNNPQSCRGADSATELTRQRAKLLNALEELDADVIGLVELENNGSGEGSAIDDIVDGLNARAIGNYAIATPMETYVGTDVIRVGIIYRTGIVALVGGSTVEILDDSDLPALGLGGPIFTGENTSRASLAASFVENASGEVFTVVVNHFKSKGCRDTGDPGVDPNADQGDGQGCYNERRLRSAEALLAWLATDPTGVNDPDVLITGDLNAYAQEDPIAALEQAGYTHLSTAPSLGDPLSYGYVFDGQWGHLDYVMASTSMLPQIAGVTDWHINADEPEVLDYDVEFKGGLVESLYDPAPFRVSDHDPVLVGLNLETDPTIFADGFESSDQPVR